MSKARQMPSPPNVVQIVADVQNARDDDPVFCRFKWDDNKDADELSTRMRQSSSTSTDANPMDLYDKVKTFVEENRKMQTVVGKLPEKIESLTKTTSELAQNMKRVRYDSLSEKD